MTLQLAVLVLYSALFITVGIYVSRRVKKADDFLVAGRSLGPGLIAATFLAATIGNATGVWSWSYLSISAEAALAAAIAFLGCETYELLGKQQETPGKHASL